MTARQKKALAALINAPTMRAASISAGVTYSTLRRWIVEDEEFRKAYYEELSVLIEDAANQARQGMTEAMSVLRQIVCDEDAVQSNRLAAAKIIIESGARLIEIQSYESRISELERLIMEVNRQ